MTLIPISEVIPHFKDRVHDADTWEINVCLTHKIYKKYGQKVFLNQEILFR